jgi:hypothetical protein
MRIASDLTAEHDLEEAFAIELPTAPAARRIADVHCTQRTITRSFNIETVLMKEWAVVASARADDHMPE